MTAAIIDFASIRARRATGQPIIDRSSLTLKISPIIRVAIDASTPSARIQARITQDGDPFEPLTVAVRCPNGIGTYRRTAPSRDFRGYLFELRGGSVGRFAGHFRVGDAVFARLQTTWRVLAEPIGDIVMLPDHPRGIA